MESPEAVEDTFEASCSGVQSEKVACLVDPVPSSSTMEEDPVTPCKTEVKPKGKTSRVSFKTDLEEEIWLDDPLIAEDGGHENLACTVLEDDAMEEIHLTGNSKKDEKSKANKAVMEGKVMDLSAKSPVAEDSSIKAVPEDPIEVEKKFIISNDTEDKIKTLGGKFVEEVICVDCYYDTPDYILTLNDCWLRKRNGKWQFKYPPKERKKGVRAAQYCETESEEVIVAELANKLRLECLDATAANTMEQLVSEHCEMFAAMETLRKTYTLEDATIDLDFLDFGFQVGEIEIVIANRNQLLHALNKIDFIAARLGLQSFAACNFSRWFPATVPMETTPR